MSSQSPWPQPSVRSSFLCAALFCVLALSVGEPKGVGCLSALVVWNRHTAVPAFLSLVCKASVSSKLLINEPKSFRIWFSYGDRSESFTGMCMSFLNRLESKGFPFSIFKILSVIIEHAVETATSPSPGLCLQRTALVCDGTLILSSKSHLISYPTPPHLAGTLCPLEVYQLLTL